ncbi:MAG: RpiB/LacA/LacB family sugar-phosphate isomerase [Patescibacteria group bacterium]
MKIYLGADHRGFELKEKIKKWLSEWGYEFEDMGAFSYDKNDDYPDFARKVAERVAKDPKHSRGVLLCGSGVGVAITANKVKGIRAGTAISAKQIKDSVNDEDTNILAISADYFSEEETKEIAKSFIEAKFSGEERHIRRINKIKEIEQNG